MSQILNFQGDQWGNFRRQIRRLQGNGQPYDLTGQVATFAVRRSPRDTAPPVISLTSVAPNVQGQITLGGPLGTILLEVFATTMGAIQAGPLYYTLQITDSLSVARTILTGRFIVTPGQVHTP